MPSERKCKCGDIFTPEPKASGRNRYRCKQCNAKAAKVYRKQYAGSIRIAEAKRNMEPVRAAMTSEASRRGKLKVKYGLTVGDYEKMLLAQNGVCAICLQPETVASSRFSRPLNTRTVRRLAVDHDHATGKVRSLLCRDCNTVLGLLKDNPDLALRIANYLRSYGR